MGSVTSLYTHLTHGAHKPNSDDSWFYIYQDITSNIPTNIIIAFEFVLYVIPQ